MRVSFIATGLLSVAGLTIAAPTVEKRALTAKQQVDDINSINTQSQDTQRIVTELPTGNIIVPTPYLVVARGIYELDGKIQTSVQMQAGSLPYDDADAQKVCDAYKTMTATQRKALEDLARKANVFARAFGSEIAPALRQVKTSVDTYSSNILGVVPACREGASEDKDKLDQMLEVAINAWASS